MLDPRLLRVGVEISGQLRWYTDVQIHATGTKYANAMQNEAQVMITNMNKQARDYTLTEATPFNRNRHRKRIIIEAGRESTGYFRLFSGDITEVTVTQPPDIVLTIKAKTGQFFKGAMVSTSKAPQVPMSTLAGDIAGDMGLSLIFEADDKNISNYSHTGSSLKQVDKLGDYGKVDAYIDDDKLIVKNSNKPLSGVSHVLSMDSGMIGIPELDAQGVKATYMLDPNSRLGGQLEIKSILNPAANGKYSIFKLSFDVTNRDIQFYTIAEAKRHGIILL